jgi:hypothetical protein
MMAGRRNKNKQSLDMGIQRKKNEGNTDNAALAQRVRQETDPTM